MAFFTLTTSSSDKDSWTRNFLTNKLGLPIFFSKHFFLSFFLTKKNMQALQSTACSEVQKAFILQEIKAKVLHKFSLKPKPVDVCINEDTFRCKPFFVTKKLDGYRCFVYFRICKFQEYQFLQIYVVDSKHNVQFLCNSNIKPTTLKSILIDAEKVDNRFYLFGIHNSKLNLIQQLGYIQLFLKEMKVSKMGLFI